MSRQETEKQTREDEFSRIFSEYHARIDEITRRTEKKLKSLNGQEEPANAVVERQVGTGPEHVAPPAVDSRTEEPDEEERPSPPVYRPPAPTRPLAGLELTELRQPPASESAEIIREARKKAKQIVEEAEQRVRKEARKKTQSQVEKILDQTRKEAEDIVNRTRQAAEEEKNEILAVSREEAEKVVAEITSRCRQESQAQSSQAIAEAKEKAQKIMADVIESGTEINRLINEIIERTARSVTDFEARLREETSDLARIITETRARLEQVNAAAREREAPPADAVPVQPEGEITSPSVAMRLLGEKTNGNNGTSPLFRGQVEMKSSSATDYQYLKNLKKYLVSIPDVKYLQEYASEKEMSVLFEVREPLPLEDVLHQVPQVEDIFPGANDSYLIVFKDQGPGWR